MIGKSDFVTILIPVYNRIDYFEECLASVFSQTYKNCLILVYDDGSSKNNSDQFQNIISKRSWSEKQRIRYKLGKSHQGIGFARDYLLHHFGTDFACWLDSDDIMHPERVEKQLKAIQQQSTDIVFCPLAIFSRGSLAYTRRIIKIDVGKYSDYESLKNNTTCASGFFKRKLKKYSFNSDLSLGSEDVLWLYTLMKAGVKIGYVNEILYFNRFHENRLGIEKQLNKNSNRKLLENIILDKEIERLS